jgi:hypothetical protein
MRCPFRRVARATTGNWYYLLVCQLWPLPPYSVNNTVDMGRMGEPRRVFNKAPPPEPKPIDPNDLNEAIKAKDKSVAEILALVSKEECAKKDEEVRTALERPCQAMMSHGSVMLPCTVEPLASPHRLLSS